MIKFKFWSGPKELGLCYPPLSSCGGVCSQLQLRGRKISHTPLLPGTHYSRTS